MAACAVCEIHAESVFKIEGMDCHEEVAILERRLKTLSGLEALHADILGQRLNIKYDAAKLTASAIAEAVAQTGMRAWLEHDAPAGPAPSAATRRLLVVASGILAGAGMALEYAAVDHRAVVAAYLLAIASGGVYSVRRAMHAARSLALDINVLMLVAVAGAMVLGQWSEGAAVVFLFALAQLLEARAMERARGAIRALMDLTPAEALVRDAAVGRFRRVAVDEVSVGDIVVVRPGEKIPLDGRVAAGESHVNQAPVTGRIAARREAARRRGLCRHDQRPRRARRRGSRGCAATRRSRASSTWWSGRRRSARRARPSSSGSRGSTRRSVLILAVAIAIVPPLAVRRELGRVDLPRAGAARDLVPVRAGDLDAGLGRVGAGRRRAQGRAHQGRRAPGAAGGRPLRRVRQDRHADQGRAARRWTSRR